MGIVRIASIGRPSIAPTGLFKYYDNSHGKQQSYHSNFSLRPRLQGGNADTWMVNALIVAQCCRALTRKDETKVIHSPLQFIFPEGVVLITRCLLSHRSSIHRSRNTRWSFQKPRNTYECPVECQSYTVIVPSIVIFNFVLVC